MEAEKVIKGTSAFKTQLEYIEMEWVWGIEAVKQEGQTETE